ncbi:MAG: hypothetical protein RLZZ09_2369 [Pseudomonadota bacterium]|jgi:uncharacterized protein YjbI with pentapeptide repeats
MQTIAPFPLALLAFGLLLSLAPAVQAASITVDNQGGYQAGVIVEDDCTGKIEEHYFPIFQTRSVDLDKFTEGSGCSKVKLTLQVAWYQLAYEDRYPTGFRRAKKGVWIIEGGLHSGANRPLVEDLKITLSGTTWWATVSEYGVTRNWRELNFRSANLSGANLSGGFMAKASLVSAKLVGANMSDAWLAGAYMAEADLSESILEHADLQGAYMLAAMLRKANLKDADLTGADLRWADLTEANLEGADLRKANLTGAKLIGSSTDFTTRCPNGFPGPCW